MKCVTHVIVGVMVYEFACNGLYNIMCHDIFYMCNAMSMCIILCVILCYHVFQVLLCV